MAPGNCQEFVFCDGFFVERGVLEHDGPLDEIADRAGAGTGDDEQDAAGEASGTVIQHAGDGAGKRSNQKIGVDDRKIQGIIFAAVKRPDYG